jgi:hypothetical protein
VINLYPFINYYNTLHLQFLDNGYPDSQDVIKKNTELIQELSKILNDMLNNFQHPTKRKELLNSPLNKEHFSWSLRDETLLTTQTEWINYWISKLRLCIKMIELLSGYLERYCNNLKSLISKSAQQNSLNIPILETKKLFYETCQSIGIALYDFIDTQKKIEDNLLIQKNDFTQPIIEDLESTVNERLSLLSREIVKLLLSNPNESILGFSAIRIYFESFVIIKSLDKIRSYIRIIQEDNTIDAIYGDLNKKDVFFIFKTLFPDVENQIIDILNEIYSKTSRTIHRAVSLPNYLIWSYWIFIDNELQSRFNNLNPSNKVLLRIISKLQADNKLYFKINSISFWYFEY